MNCGICLTNWNLESDAHAFGDEGSVYADMDYLADQSNYNCDNCIANLVCKYSIIDN